MKIDYSESCFDKFYFSVLDDMGKLPFSFIYSGKTYNGFSSENFSLKSKNITKGKGKESAELVFDFVDDIKISVLITHYFSHGVTEWTVRFKNCGKENTSIFENLKTEIILEGGLPVLKGILGDHVNKYKPYIIDLSKEKANFTSDSGRATHVNFPYFNLEHGDGGTMLAIGWAGTWNASFVYDGSKTVYSASAVNGLKTYLKANETIRTALFVMAPYKVRDEHYSTNFWRSWFIEHNLPKADEKGTELSPFSTCCLASDTGLPNSDGSISERCTTWRPSLEKMIKEDVKVDFRWFDAGWYIRPDGRSEETDWWGTVGTWALDPIKWPEGTFLESTDFARANGMKTLVWFEPERVTDPENLAKNYGYNVDWAIRVEGEGTISNNIGDPECFRWTTDRICKMLRDNKVEMYREDNNCNAAKLWAHLDAIEGENRSGITECKFIDAHYRMWDEFIACTLSNGGCGFVDSCASGGGRNDLESMRRGVPLLRSDSDRTSTSLRLSMTSSFNKWIPFCGANTKEKVGELDARGISDKYVWRVSYLPALNVDSQFVQDPNQNFEILRFGLKEWKKISPFLLSSFYTLTPWHDHTNTTDFTAFVYYDHEKEAGAILAFRPKNCEEEKLLVKMPFAKPGQTYTFEDEDDGVSLCSDGTLSLLLREARTAKLIWVKLN